MNDHEEDRTNSHSGSEVPPLEWAVASVGLVLVLGSLFFMIYLALQDPSSPPDIVVTVESVAPVQAGYRVLYVARNDGSKTAGALQIRGELRNGPEVLEERKATLDYLPPHSQRRGGLFFEQDPGQHQLHLFPVGYEEP